MKKIAFMIDGGAGRILTAIPALLKYIRNNKDDEVVVLIGGWDTLLFGIPELQNITYSFDVKGVFKNKLKDCDVVISPEPYRVPNYYNQKISLAEAFDEIINSTTDHSDLETVCMVLDKKEEKTAAEFVKKVREIKKKKKTIVIQPFGRSAENVSGDIIDTASRSIEPEVYVALLKKLSTKYNLIFFGERNVAMEEDYTAKNETDLRGWASIIDAADYFIGCDSVGQHMARAFDIPGTIIIGSTFPINTSYPDFFNIIENESIEKEYSPLRICGFDSHLADRLNDRCMEFTPKEVDAMYKNIVKDIEKKVK